jgi:hypothetical protein
MISSATVPARVFMDRTSLIEVLVTTSVRTIDHVERGDHRCWCVHGLHRLDESGA